MYALVNGAMRYAVCLRCYRELGSLYAHDRMLAARWHIRGRLARELRRRGDGEARVVALWPRWRAEADPLQDPPPGTLDSR